jgi:hypothetical protein
MAGLWAKIDAHEAEAERERDKAIILSPRRPRTGFRAFLAGRPRLAAALLILLSASALAFVAPRLWRPLAAAHWTRPDAVSASGGGQGALPRPGAAGMPGGSGSGAGAGNAPLPLGPPASNCRSSSLSLEPELSREVDQVAAEARVRMLLPHTETEWEAWARKEYPHVMWVYDVLTRPEYGINWDGQPKYIPEWAQRLWKDPATRLTGWRALVCYSGEILKFDFPESADAPNVRPTVQAMEFASAVAGYKFRLEARGKWHLPLIAYTDFEMQDNGKGINLVSLTLDVCGQVKAKRTLDTGKEQAYNLFVLEYVNRVLDGEICLTKPMIYISATSQCLAGRDWQDLAKRSSSLLALINKSRTVKCDKDSIRLNYKYIFTRYLELITKSYSNVDYKFIRMIVLLVL